MKSRISQLVTFCETFRARASQQLLHQLQHQWHEWVAPSAGITFWKQCRATLKVKTVACLKQH